MAKARDFTFFILVGHMKCKPRDDKLSLKSVWSRSHDFFKFLELSNNIW